MARKKDSRPLKTKPANIDHAMKVAKALDLRRAGLSYSKIAQQLGWNSPQACQDAVSKAIRSIVSEPVEELVEFERQRLDDLFVQAYRVVQDGDVSAVSAAIKIMERRAKLLGLDMPTKIAPTNVDGTESYQTVSVDECIEVAIKVLANNGYTVTKNG